MEKLFRSPRGESSPDPLQIVTTAPLDQAERPDESVPTSAARGRDASRLTYWRDTRPMDDGWPRPTWIRDWPDPRDWSPLGEPCRGWWEGLKRRGGRAERPASFDLRDYFSPVPRALPRIGAAAQACIWALQAGERRASGERLDLAPEFVHAVAERLRRIALDGAADLRTTLKTLTRFGAPPARLWHDRAAQPGGVDDPVLHGFRDAVAPLHYMRLDGPDVPAAHLISRLRGFLLAGFAVVGGVALAPELIEADALAFPTRFDTVAGGFPLVIAGFDDRRRIRSTKGALLVRGTWSLAWGDSGYGWLPYRFVEERLAADLWVVVRPGWLTSGEFTRPI